MTVDGAGRDSALLESHVSCQKQRAAGNETELPRLLRVPQVAELAEVSEWTVRAEIRRGNLRAGRIGRVVRVTPDDYRSWVEGTAESQVGQASS